MRFILKTTFGLAVVSWSFAFAGELKAGNREDAEKALTKFENHFASIDKNGTRGLEGSDFQVKYINLLFMKMEMMDKGMNPKSAAQFDQLLDITSSALADVTYHEFAIQGAYRHAMLENLTAHLEFLKEDWSKCINACHKAEAHLAKIELHLPKYPQKAELARRALFRVERLLGEGKIGKSSVKKLVNKSQK